MMNDECQEVNERSARGISTRPSVVARLGAFIIQNSSFRIFPPLPSDLGVLATWRSLFFKTAKSAAVQPFAKSEGRHRLRDMADDQFSLSIDTDWKKQAQEEKRRLVEEAQKKAAAAPAPVAAGGGVEPSSRGGQRGGKREGPVTFGSLVQTVMTQALFYLGDLSPEGGEGNVNLDRAKNQVDTLSLLEEKTVNNLSEEETRMMNLALYEVRTRFISVASQYI
jgi:hypothetical protein